MREPGGQPAGSPPAESPTRRPSRLRQSVSAATDRIEEIIDAAERVADEIQRDAEEEAERYLAERRREADQRAAEQVQQLEGALARLRERLASIETQGAEMVAEAERAIEVSGSAGEQPEAQPPPVERRGARRRRWSDSVGAAAPGAASAADAGEASPETEPTAGPPEGELRERAVIRATEMAVGGSKRAEIESALRDELGVAEPAPIVDEILSD